MQHSEQERKQTDPITGNADTEPRDTRGWLLTGHQERVPGATILYSNTAINAHNRWLRHTGKGKDKCIAVHDGTPSHSYGVSLAIWDHTVLPATRHKWTHPAFTPARQAGTRFTDQLNERVKDRCYNSPSLIRTAIVLGRMKYMLAGNLQKNIFNANPS